MLRLSRLLLMFSLVVAFAWWGTFQSTAAVASADRAALPAATGLAVERVRLGLDGKYKVGCWTLVQVTVSGDSAAKMRGRLEVTVPDGDDVPTKFVATSCRPFFRNKKTGESVWRGYVKFGRVHSSLTVDFFGDEGTHVRRLFSASEFSPAVTTRQELVVVVGGDLDIAEAVRPWRRAAAEGVIAARVQRAESLPDCWWGYEGVDQLVLLTADTELYEKMTPRQIEAMRQWVRMGGKLILSVGARGRVLLGEKGKLSPFSPGTFTNTTAVLETSGLETIVKGRRLDLTRSGRSSRLRLSRFAKMRGRVLLWEDVEEANRPLVIATPYGMGRVVFVAIDLDSPLLTDWKGQPRFMAWLLNPSPEDKVEVEESQQSHQAVHEGYDDISGQLRSALDQFDGVYLLPFSLIVVLLLLYIAVIGPVDYFFLRKCLRQKMHWTWLTFPVAVLVFCAIAWGLAHWTKGDRLRINQVDIVDVDMETGIVRGTTWAAIYSPKSDTYDLTLATTIPESSPTAPGGSLLAWRGLPGKGLGGMNNGTATGLSADAYEIGPCDDTGDVENSGDTLQVREMPIRVWSSKQLGARWWGASHMKLQSGLKRTVTGQLQGTIVNPLDVDLEHCVLLYGRWAYPLDHLAAGESIAFPPVESSRQPWSIRRRLRKESESKADTTSADATRRKIPQIVEQMMFYKAAHGRTLTGLANRHHHFIDLSDHLMLGRAILVGRSSKPISQLQRDGQAMQENYDKHETFYRMIIPVDERENKDE